MKIDRYNTYLVAGEFIDLLDEVNDCMNVTKEECDNCPYHKLCDFMLDLQDIILL